MSHVTLAGNIRWLHLLCGANSCNDKIQHTNNTSTNESSTGNFVDKIVFVANAARQGVLLCMSAAGLIIN